jgi:hypothetical protein
MNTPHELPLIDDREVLASTLSAKAVRLQVRKATSPDYVAELRERLKAGDVFPAIDCVADGKTTWVTDGIHRLDAAMLSHKTIRVRTFRGSYPDAIARACRANHDHGMRRTNADKRRAVELAIETFPEHGDNVIAALCCVSAGLVKKHRPSTSESHSSNGELKRIGLDGKRRPAMQSRKKARISGGTSFEPAELEIAPSKPAPTPVNGRPTVTADQRKKCHDLLGKLNRALDDIGLADEFVQHFTQMERRIDEV